MKTINKLNKFLVLFALFLFLRDNTYSQYYGWSPVGSLTSGYGTNGYINAITNYNGNLIVAGLFTQVGNMSASNIALWNGFMWQALGPGLNGEVYALAVYNNQLYAGGYFTQSGSTVVNRIARWNGFTWSPVGSGMNDEVDALALYNSMLIMGGKFSNISQNICAWDGSNWYTLGSGVNDDVLALTVYNGELVAGGRFTLAGGNAASMIAKWNGSSWISLSNNTDERIHALGVYNSNLIAGGRFTTIGGVSANYIAQYNGTSWSSVGGGVDDRVFSLAVYRGELIAGGQFKYAGNSGLYVDRITKWNGSSWSRMITGMNEKVLALWVQDTSLYAGGEFITAGGKVVYKAARWSNQVTFSVEGEARFADNNQPISAGKVKGLRLDLNSRELIVVDTGTISNGYYRLNQVPRDSTFIILFPSDEFEDFVPTYYPSTTNWTNAVRVYPQSNLTGITVLVYRIIPPGPQVPFNVSVGGYVYLNYMPPLISSQPFPFKSGSIVYAKQGNNYVKFAVSSETEQYTMLSLPPGLYDVYVNRAGYTSAFASVNVSSFNIDTLNFTLDTTSLIGIKNINSEVPKSFELKQNYPNPFNPVTRIQFSIASGGFVRLSVFNILGQDVEILVNKSLKAGKYEVSFNAFELPSGVYFYKLVTGDFSQTKKMVLIK
jgi:hypothetical protein